MPFPILKIIFIYLSFISTIGARLVVHERRDKYANPGLNRQRINEDVLLPMRIGLRENSYAVENAEKWLMEVSSPDSALFGQHWTQEQIIDAFQPSSDTIRNVTAWLNSHGIFRFTHSDNKLWFAFDLSARRAEVLLQTEFYEHEVKGEGIEVSSDYYYLPDHLQPHVHYITPGVKGSDITGRTSRKTAVKRDHAPLGSYMGLQRRELNITRLPPPAFTTPDSLEHCAKVVTPACIRALYNFSAPDQSLSVSPNNSLGIFESIDTYWQGDLNLFYRYFAPEIPLGTGPLFDRIDHGLLPINKTRGVNWERYLGEEILDLQCSIPIIYPQTATIFEVGPSDLHKRYDGNFFNRFLDAVDGSYCTPGQRGNSSEGALPMCGTFKPTNVLSYSWGIPEHEFSFFWQERQCNEYLKLGLQGTSVFICSQDWGVGKLGQWSRNFYGPKCNRDYENSARVFMPAFPAACPWVTSVGATEMHLGNTVNDPEIGAAWSFFNGSSDKHEWSDYSSGGGFALHFDTPGYQKDALSTFFKDHNPRWPYFTDGRWSNGTGRYNRNGRGIPDISAAGRNVAGFEGNGYSSGAGTSAATPIWAALINRINEDRLRAGKSTLGFINPTLYKHPEMLNDVTAGKNGYCNKDEGFEAVEGWDPMTGLGTPNYGLMHDVFMNLP